MKSKFYERAPSTKRRGSLLALVYGAPNLKVFAKELPDNAVAADIGSGAALLGHAVVARRTDVTWFNVDRRYDNMGRARRAQANTPPNLQYIAGDALRLPFAPGSLDRIYSSAMLTHIILDSRSLAEDAVHSMAAALKPTGELAIGGFSVWPWPDAVHMTAAEYSQNPDTAVRMVVDELTPSMLAQNVLKGVIAATHALGSEQFSRR